jgi:hypothetical protein
VKLRGWVGHGRGMSVVRVSHQPSAVSHQPWAIGHQASAAGGVLRVIGCRLRSVFIVPGAECRVLGALTSLLVDRGFSDPGSRIRDLGSRILDLECEDRVWMKAEGRVVLVEGSRRRRVEVGRGGRARARARA